MTEPDNTSEQPEAPQEAEREDPSTQQSTDEGQPDDQADAKPKKKRKKANKQPIDLSKVADPVETDADAPVDAAASEDVSEPAEGQGPQDTPKPQESRKARAESPEEKLDDAVREAREMALRAAVEAIIFAADDPVTPAAIAKAIGDAKPSGVKKAIEQLRTAREDSGSGIAITEVAGGWTMLTNEEYAPAIRRLRKATESRKLTGAALETLAVVAYKQPIQKQEIEDIRGVSCGPILRTLMEQNLVKIAGRAEALGRPLLYATTKRFLDVFGIASLKDLPKMSELTRS